jgi:hypothetical protein
MGILVPESVLPSGIAISNVYMSFTSETIYVRKNQTKYSISSWYRVYKDDTKQLDSNIRIPILCEVDDISQGVYEILYDKLKEHYPDSFDVI